MHADQDHPSRRPELDGVRGVAIALVLFGHGAATWHVSPFASAGVTLFFVLSGYLITGVLVRERDRTGRVELGRFYLRRLTRLAPPLLAMVVVIALWDRAQLTAVASALTWTANYVDLVSEGTVGPFGHTWSLGVEEQFYLLWPVVLLVLLRTKRPARAAGIVLGVLLVWRVGHTVAGNYRYGYLALETAGSAIIAGCVVALRPSLRLPGWAVPASLAAIAVVSAGASVLGDQAWMIVPLLVTIPCAALVAAAGSAPWLAWRPLVFLGIVSYSLYLWHDPVSRVLFDDGLNPVGVVAGIVVGLVAYLVVELPVMRWRSRARVRQPDPVAPGAAV
jgi:peptidoglycan/LPS O-acetylase OafA/YrhL